MTHSGDGEKWQKFSHLPSVTEKREKKMTERNYKDDVGSL